MVAALIRSCLNRPFVLDADTRAQAELVTELCRLGATGYALVAVQTIRGEHAIEGVNPARLACEALHRSLVESWATLHQLFALAERQQLARLPIDDPLRETRSSIVEEYLPPLLLACAKPNQLRQQDIAGAYRAFEEWRDKADLQDPQAGTGLFAVDINSDQPPVFAELLVRRGATQFRYVNTEKLVSYLEDLKHQRGTVGVGVVELDRQTRLDTNLLEHLIKSLGQISQRSFNRHSTRIGLYIATGISNVHYFVAGERSLMQVMHGDDYVASAASAEDNPFLAPPRKADMWIDDGPDADVVTPGEHAHAGEPIPADALTRAAEAQEQRAGDPVRYMVHSVQTTNAGPGGYCVEWDDPPTAIHIGDIVSVREADNDRADWTIAAIRWIGQVKDKPTLLGLELLSPRGSAFAAQVKMANGELSRPIRVLLLPEIPIVGQPHTLVVPRMVFREGQRIHLCREHDAFLVKLKRQVASTGYFSQMNFDYIRHLDDEQDVLRKNGALPTSAFDSVWNDI